MRIRNFALVLALLLPSTAMAGPITVGTWSPTAAPVSSDASQAELGLLPFWSNPSWDGVDLAFGNLVNAYDTVGLEYLHDGTGNYTAFRFDEEIVDLTKLFGFSGWNGALGIENGVFTYSGVSGTYTSMDTPEQFALFRLVSGDSTRYFLGVEDILYGAEVNDRDYNDYVASFTTQPVPEPGTLLLLGSGVAALAARRKLSGRKSQQLAN